VAVELTLEGSRPQRRLTIAFRGILAIPHWIFAGVLSVVAVVVVFFAWFVVLFTARMPQGMGDFLTRILQYQARVYAYGQHLLTDRYPPFDIGRIEYPVMLELDEPDRFNRAAVLFRFVLQLPALFVTQLISAGVTLILFFVWLVTLVAGQMPTSAYLGLAAILRYQLRTWAYMGMLTTDYPRGLFGDRDEYASSGPIVGVTDTSLPSSPRVDRLVLPTGAKVLVALSLVFGSGWFAFNVATGSFSFDFDLGTSTKLADAGDTFDDAYDSWATRSAACATSTTPACQRAANAALRTAIRRLESSLAALDISSSALDERADVRRDLEEMRSYLVDATETSAPEDLMRLRFQVEDTKVVYDRDIDDLLTAVAFG
jgi:hypothetical protein